MFSMIPRTLNPSKQNSFFLFGARGTGKTYFLRNQFFAGRDDFAFVDLLDPRQSEEFLVDAKSFGRFLEELPKNISWVAIDEIQKKPALLDIVHKVIEERGLSFALTGSSARKLKHGAANLLAGRAFTYNLFPLTTTELGGLFNLESTLAWGSLPALTKFSETEDRIKYLTSYTYTYLQEEIAQEQVVRKLEPFRKFLFVASQSSGKIVNYANIARDVGVNPLTVQSYFEILDETMIGLILEPFHESVRKRQRKNPKFYFYDTGVWRALSRTLSVELKPQTYAFGVAFEHFIINEINRRKSYLHEDYLLFYLRTKDDVEIDLIIDRPGLPLALIEIKSSVLVREEDVKALNVISKSFGNAKSYCLSLDPNPKRIGNVSCLPWQQGLSELEL